MILAFVHIEKTAGTTLNQILRRNFFLRFIDVRPLSRRSGRSFTASDLRRYVLINPRLEAISGHAIRPTVPLAGAPAAVRYITVLRDPARRYLSQYLYFVKIKERKDEFRRYLDQEEFTNFQTRKLVGSGDTASAISVLNGMFAVGATEEFDALLLRLKKALWPLHFDARYTSKNVSRGTSERAAELLDRYGAEIRDRNEKDQLIYDHLINHVIPRHNVQYGSRLPSDLELLRRDNTNFRAGIRDYVDYATRKLYYAPITGVLRRLNGLPASGSY